MSCENQYAEDFEDNQIKGVSDLRIDLTKCCNILTEDLKYTIYHDDYNISIVNNIEKDLISKKIFTKKIEKVKAYPNNFVSYILNDDEGSTIITTHIDCIEDNLEMKRPFRIIDYLIFNFLAPLEFYLYLNSNGDIHVCRNAEIISKNTNIFRDVNTIDRNFSFTVEDVSKIYYSEETQNLIIFFTQGKLLNYFIDTSAFIPEKTYIDYRNINQLSILIFQDFLDLVSCKDFPDVDNSRNSYLNKDKINCEIISVKTIAQQIAQTNNIEYYLVVGFNHSKVSNKFEIFFFINNSMKSERNYINESNKDVNSVYRLIPYINKIDYFNSFKINEQLNINSFNLFDLILFNSNFSLSEKLSNKLPNTVLFVMKSQHEEIFYIFICSLEKFFLEKNLVKIDYFSFYTVDGKINSILNLSQLGIFNEDYNDGSIDLNNLCISIRATYAKNKNQIYILDDVLVHDDINNYKKEYEIIKEKDQIIIKYVFEVICTKDPYDYFDFYQRVLNENVDVSNYELQFKFVIKKLFQSKLSIDEVDLTHFDQINSLYKFDSYLSYLIFSNDYLAIKKYLSIMDPKKEDFPFFNNEKLFFTIQIMYTIISKEILSKQKENLLNLKFFSNQNLLEILGIMSKLLYVNKSRAENSIFKTYNLEKEILVENSNAISQLIEKVESLILIVKILNCISSGRYRIRDYSVFESHNFQYFYAFVALLFPKIEKKILPEINLFYINYMDSFLDLKRSNFDINENNNSFYIQNELNLVLKNSIYTSKFFLFLVYIYYAILSEVLKLTENNQAMYFSLIGKDRNLTKQIKSNIINSLSEVLNEEINSYFDLVFQIFLLDYNSNLKSNKIYSEINLKTNYLSEIILFLNKENYCFSPINGSTTAFNSSFLSYLIEDEKFEEALVISKNIIPYYKEYDELICQLKIFMHMDLLNMGFQFINDCFAYLIKLPNVNYNHLSRSETAKKKFFDELKQDNNFLILTFLYQEFFKFLIINNKIEFLFNLPLNIVERNILKDLILSEGKLEHLIILYYMKIKNISGAEISFNEIKSSGNFNEDNFNIYSKFIKAMKFIFGKKDANLVDDWVNEGVDNQLLGSANKDYKMGINFRNNNILFKGKLLINKLNNLNERNENQMDIVDNLNLQPTSNRNLNNKIENFAKKIDPIGKINYKIFLIQKFNTLYSFILKFNF